MKQALTHQNIILPDDASAVTLMFAVYPAQAHLASRATLSIEADLGHSVGITFYNPATLAALRDVLNSADAAAFMSVAVNA
jgi:hypothetical protein